MSKNPSPLSYLNCKFEHLTIIKVFRKDKVWWCTCVCDCGTIKDMLRFKDVINRTKSCGCLNSENAKNRLIGLPGLHTTHGSSDSYLYELWQSIKQRCYNKNNKSYDCYGGRGIVMYGPWINDFQRFETDIVNEIGHKPFIHLSLERCNNEGNYEPENICWADSQEQNNNRRKPQRNY